VIPASSIHASTATHWASSGFLPIAAITPFIWLQVETNYAIMSATFPTMGTVLKALNTRWGALDGPDVAQYAMESLSGSRGAPSRLRGTRHDSKHVRVGSSERDPRLRPDGNNYTFQVGSRPEVKSGKSRRNSDGSDMMIIRKTVSTSVSRVAKAG
jgi:hypothetical protein